MLGQPYFSITGQNRIIKVAEFHMGEGRAVISPGGRYQNTINYAMERLLCALFHYPVMSTFLCTVSTV